MRRGDTPASDARKPEIEGRERMTASGRWVREGRKIGFQVDAKGARQMGRLIGLESPGTGAHVQKIEPPGDETASEAVMSGGESIGFAQSSLQCESSV